MRRFRPFVLSICAALSFALMASPAMAKPGNGGPNIAPRNPFPLNSAAFTLLVNSKVKQAEATLNQALKTHKVDPKLRRQINKDFKRSVRVIRAAVIQVSKDNKVTKKEARHIRRLSKRMHKKLRRKYRQPRKASAAGKAGNMRRVGKGQRDGSSRFNPVRPQ